MTVRPKDLTVAGPYTLPLAPPGSLPGIDSFGAANFHGHTGVGSAGSRMPERSHMVMEAPRHQRSFSERDPSGWSSSGSTPRPRLPKLPPRTHRSRKGTTHGSNGSQGLFILRDLRDLYVTSDHL